MAIATEDLKAYLAQKMGLDPDEVDNDTPLFSSGLMDSFSMLDLIMFIEKSGGFRVRPTEVNLDNLDSIDRILAYTAARSS